MIADVKDLQSATALIAQHVDTLRWGVILKFGNGMVWQSEDTFGTSAEAQAALDQWTVEIGGAQHQLH